VVADILSGQPSTNYEPPTIRPGGYKPRMETLEGYDEGWMQDIAKSDHLRKYLENLLEITTDPPILVEELKREFAKNKSPNYIYRAGDTLAGNQVYIHILTDKISRKFLYQAIEPRVDENRNELMAEIDKRIALLIDDKENYNSVETKTEYLFGLLDQIVKVGKNNEFNKLFDEANPDKKPKKIKRNKKITVDQKTYDCLRYEIYCEKIGSSLLEPLIRDLYIEDIHCAGRGPIHISHKTFGTVETSMIIEDPEELDDFVLNLSEIVGKPASHRDPIIDAKMPDGSRLNLVFGDDVSTRGSNFTIRKFAADPLSICQIIDWGTMTSLLAAYCWILLEEKMSLWICGETASGKTTTLSAITMFIPDDYKIVSIEEVPEVYVPHKNWIREVVRETGNAASDEKGAVSMFQLLKAALRQRPTYIIVGEVRGQEGMIAFQAMQTGHASMATFHAADVAKLVQRLTNYPITVPKTHIDNLHCALFQSAVHDATTGRYKRRVLAINEILGYEPAEGMFNFVEVFSFDAAQDTQVFRGRGTSFLLDAKIAIMRGYEDHETPLIYEELYDRAEILEYMIALGILEYGEVIKNLQWIQQVGVESALTRFKRQALMELGGNIEKEISEKVGRFSEY
jgi:flagellar protein FlaI